MLKQKILEDLKLAMKAGDTAKRDTLRMLDSMVKNSEIEKKKREEGLSDEETQEVIARAIKQRKDSASQYASGGREDLAQKENTEIEILSVYMPAQLSDEEARVEVLKIIAEVGAVSKSEIGKVMGKAMTVLKGKVDGNLVKKIVEEELQ
ncbi:MAG: GatB/YqeY domain-containing protein [bacterium]|nr:GatB/YqeY domain-containing protein [bacterium]